MEESKLTTPIKQIAKNTKRLFSLAWRMDKRTTILYYLTAAIGALVPVASAYVLKLLIDYLQIAQNSFVTTIPVIVAVILAARYLVTLLDGVIYSGLHRSYLDYVFRYELQNEITMKFHRKISKLDIAHFENSEVQDLITKTRDTMQWRLPDYLRTFAEFFRDIVAFVAAFIVLLPFGLWIPILISIITIPRLYFQAKYGAIQWSIWGSGAPQTKKLWYLNYLLQEPMTVRETRISQSSESLLNKFQEIQRYLFNLSKSALDKYLRVLTIPPIIESIVIFFIAYHFLPPVVTGALTIGSYTLLISMLEQLGSRSANASMFFAHMYESNLYVNHYFDFLALPQLIPTTKNPVILEEIKPPKIEFRNVSFNYPKGQKVLDEVSFVIEPGESVALVGHNGAGKTTIVKLLCRFYDVSDGEILINDINIKALDLPRWYKFLGTLFQEFVRYHFTVRENIFLGAPEKKDENAMIEAARKSGAAEFIEQLPKKYDTILGKELEDGEELSGGQWQKLAIARAFYEEPPVLILDEPTSAIDAEAEYEIFSNLEKQYKNKTLILVSHRFSTVRNANKIVVIDHGKIIESGSHQELMKLGGQYAKLFSIQAKGYQ
ncbi:MAG: ABC transporter ATP-binding protein [Candidatus Vogelbacteria bacterium]|nr:ABC transporter ATP-binding protein [Candidatus Vogelbacteria bacterium]